MDNNILQLENIILNLDSDLVVQKRDYIILKGENLCGIRFFLNEKCWILLHFDHCIELYYEKFIPYKKLDTIRFIESDFVKNENGEYFIRFSKNVEMDKVNKYLLKYTHLLESANKNRNKCRTIG